MKNKEKTNDFATEQNKFNEYFESLPVWDGIDHIGNMAKNLKPVEITPKVDETIRLDQLFRKMLVSMVANSMGTDLNKKCLVLICEKQGSGKSTFLRWLCPPNLAYYSGAVGTSKDDMIAMTENFIFEFGELSRFSESDFCELKGVLSNVAVNVRIPYAEHPVMLQRRCNFVASANSFNFLLNVTPSKRLILFHLSEIDWNYKINIDINKVWSQAFHLLKSTEFEYRLTEKEEVLGKLQQQMYLSKILETKCYEMRIEL